MSDNEEEEVFEVPVIQQKSHNLSSYVTEFNDAEKQPTTFSTALPTKVNSSPRIQSFHVPSPTSLPVPSTLMKRASSTKEKKLKHSTTEKKAKTSSSDVQLKNEVDRLRNLVNLLSTKLENIEKDLQKPSIHSSSSSVHTMNSDIKENETTQSILAPILQGPTSDPTMVLDLIENDKAVYHSGWMNKKGRKVRNWKRRWFVLKGNKLSYFNKEGEKNALGEINLETCMIDELKEREESGRPCMALLVEGRKLFFCADTPEENRRWYLYLVCKNSELSYLRKLKHLGKQSDNSLLSFLEHPMVKDIRFDLNVLTIDSAVALTPPLRIHETLTIVSLKNCSVDNLCLSSLCEALKVNISVETLELDDNEISVEGAKHLAKVLSVNPVLKSISLKGNKLKDEGVIEIAKVLASGAHPRLTELNLDRNDIGAHGAVEFANSLSKMPRFPVISLSDNHIGDEGAEAILQLCAQNNTIHTIKLQNNNIGNGGVVAIANALKSIHSLTHLYLSSNQFDRQNVRLLTETLLENQNVQYAEYSSYKLDSSNLCALRLLHDCHLLG